jgi:isopenicillin N synthase-like dioxygenase
MYQLENINQLMDCGYTFVNLPKELATAITMFFTEGEKFFAEPLDVKSQYTLKKTISGYRELGLEYSRSSDNVDLNESFSWKVSDSHYFSPDFKMSTGAELLFMQMQDIAKGILKEIADYFDRELTFGIEDNSWLQYNYYTPHLFDRELLQSEHFDGHIITLFLSDAHGMEVLCNQTHQYVTIPPESTRLLVMASELLAHLTNNSISPLPHRVRNFRHLIARNSLLFFVHPDHDYPILPWVTEGSVNIIEGSIKHILSHPVFNE